MNQVCCIIPYNLDMYICSILSSSQSIRYQQDYGDNADRIHVYQTLFWSGAVPPAIRMKANDVSIQAPGSMISYGVEVLPSAGV